MSEIAFQIPIEIKKIISRYPKVQWEKVVRDTLWNFSKKIQLMDKITSKSKWIL